MDKTFLPVNLKELQERGAARPDFVLVSADAYVDHPSFGHAVIGRTVESEGFSVGIIAQPLTDADYKVFGEPAYGFLISGGVVDSMVNNYTAAKKKRNDDVYSPGGKAGFRPDRAVSVYANKLRGIYKNSPIVIGGIEASLRRLSHYDYWSDKVRPSILCDSPADLLIYGLGEKTLREIFKEIRRGIPLNKIRHIRGTAYIDKKENLSRKIIAATESNAGTSDYIILSSFSEVQFDKQKFAENFRIESGNTDAASGKTLIQENNGRYVIINPPQHPLNEEECDRSADLPYTRQFHPMYASAGGIPALEEVKFSVISARGCFGSCSFCALNYHQGRTIQPRSDDSIIKEAEELTKDKDFKGYIHDIGGPTANFRERACDKQSKLGACGDKYCIGSKPCPNLTVSHRRYLALLQKIRNLPKVKKVFIRSGIRFDYMMMDKDGHFFDELVKYHVSGQLKVAPEHTSDKVLRLMNKPPFEVYQRFYNKFYQITKRQNLEQFLVPYFISSHPGAALEDAVNLALYLKSINYTPKQVQDFYPTPATRSTCMYYTGIDPDTGESVYTAKTYEEKAMQRALLQYSNPKNYDLVRKALKQIGREDLIGGRGGLVPAEFKRRIEKKRK